MTRPASEIEMHPVKLCAGEVRVPASKSYTNRALLVAALGCGESTVRNLLVSDDTRYMLDALEVLGFEVRFDEASREAAIIGRGGKIPSSGAELSVGNAGTAMRFLTAALCLGEGRYRIDGNKRMRERPIGPLVDGLRKLGAGIEYELREGCPPLAISANGLRGGSVSLPGEISSQYASALLMSGIYGVRGLNLTVEGELVSRPYVDMTLAVMAAFGVHVGRDGYERFTTGPGQAYKASEYAVEADASAATYFLAAGALAGGPVRVLGLSADSLQGDVAFARTLEEMGARVVWGPDWIEVSEGTLAGVDVDYSDMSDAALTLAVVAACARGVTCIRNVGNMRLKETDRLAALARELSRLGIAVNEHDDGLEITGGPMRGDLVRTYDDHRMAMSFALAGLRFPGIRIENPGCVSKTYPGFFDDLAALRQDD